MINHRAHVWQISQGLEIRAGRRHNGEGTENSVVGSETLVGTHLVPTGQLVTRDQFMRGKTRQVHILASSISLSAFPLFLKRSSLISED